MYSQTPQKRLLPPWFIYGNIVPLFRGAELPDTFYSIAYIYEESPYLVIYVTKNYFTVSGRLRKGYCRRDLFTNQRHKRH
jgi:hypothetical protein